MPRPRRQPLFRGRQLTPVPGPEDIARGYFASGVEIADTNGDGYPDIFLGNFNNTLVTILTGRGDGTVDPPQHYVSASGPEATTFADFDGDGIEDLIVTNGGDSGTIMGGRGTAHFAGFEEFPQDRLASSLVPKTRLLLTLPATLSQT